MKHSHLLKIAKSVAVLLGAFIILSASDWPQWRGPNRDGYANGFSVPKDWPEKLTELWNVSVGEGHSSPVVAEGKIYLLTRQGEDEVVLCLEASTGKQLWKAHYPAAYEMDPAARGHGKGPKSTPVVQGKHLLTFGINGVLSCFDAGSGQLKWRKEFSSQYRNTSPTYGTAMSPIVDGRLCIAHVGGQNQGALTAFDLETGMIQWQYRADGPAYSSPIVGTLGGVRQLVTYTQNGLVGISPTTGALLWKITAKRPYDTNCVTPVLYKDMLIFSQYEQGISAIRVSKKGSEFVVNEIWRNPANESYMSTPVIHDSLLFGFSYRNKGQFYCIDADSGKTLWQSPGRRGENAAIVNTGQVLMLLTDEAKLVILKPSSERYQPIKEYEVAASPTWAHPVALSNRLLVKDRTTLRLLSFSPR